MRTPALFGRTRPVEIRGLSSDQAPDCARLHAQAFPHPWDENEFERLIGAKTAYGNAAVENRTGATIGFILSRRAADEAEVLSIVVDPSARRLGVATRLLAANVDCLRRVGVRTLFLEVAEANHPAHRLYAAFGFVEAGRREGYYRVPGGKPATALTLRKGLDREG